MAEYILFIKVICIIWYVQVIDVLSKMATIILFVNVIYVLSKMAEYYIICSGDWRFIQDGWRLLCVQVIDVLSKMAAIIFFVQVIDVLSKMAAKISCVQVIDVLSKMAGLWINTDKKILYSQNTHITFICPMRDILKHSEGDFGVEWKKTLSLTKNDKIVLKSRILKKIKFLCS